MEPEIITPPPGGADDGADSKIKPQKFSTSQTDTQELRDTLLGELRCELLFSKLATLEIESLGIALNCGLISVRQCLALQRESSTWKAIQ